MQVDLLAVAVLDELLDRSFDQSHAAVVAVQLHVADEVVDGAEAVLALRAEDEFHVVPLVEDGLDVEILDDQRDGLAVVPVRRVADQAGAGAGALADEEHGNVSLRRDPRLCEGSALERSPRKASGRGVTGITAVFSDVPSAPARTWGP